jgi:hypothetical protein
MQPIPPTEYEEPHDTGRETKRLIVFGARVLSYLVYFYLLVVEVILTVGFFLKLFGANPTSGFVEWWYRNLDRVMQPFDGIFDPIEIGQTQSDVAAEFETSVLFAMIVYGILALVLHAVISWLTDRIHRIDRQAEAERQRAAYERAQAEMEARRAAAGLAPTQPIPPTPPPAPPQPGQPGTPGY